MTDRKLRVLHVVVQPVLVYDDGTELTEGPQTRPSTVPLSALGDMAERIAAEVEAFSETVERESDDAPGN